MIYEYHGTRPCIKLLTNDRSELGAIFGVIAY